MHVRKALMNATVLYYSQDVLTLGKALCFVPTLITSTVVRI